MHTAEMPPGGIAETMDADAWFDEVFERTKETLLRFIFVRLDNPDQVDDVFQEVYSQLFQRIRRKGWHDIQEPVAFLTTIAKREISRQRRAWKRTETVRDDEAVALIPCPESAFEEALEQRSKVEEVRAAVQEMPPLTYKVFALYYFFDMSLAAIAAELHMTENAVKCRLNRARNRARTAVQED